MKLIKFIKRNCLTAMPINSSHKKFWRYIKSLRRDNAGVPPLKHGSSLTSDPHDKAKILNDQFFSVFTHEDLSDLSQCSSSI